MRFNTSNQSSSLIQTLQIYTYIICFICTPIVWLKLKYHNNRLSIHEIICLEPTDDFILRYDTAILRLAIGPAAQRLNLRVAKDMTQTTSRDTLKFIAAVVIKFMASSNCNERN